MRPNILFITIDSLRADRCRSKIKTSKTPNMDKLIDNGIYFSQAFSTADQTGTSISSLFTSSFPIQTGTTQFNFSEDTRTYFDILKESGYQLGSFVPDLDFFKRLTSKFDNKNDLQKFEKFALGLLQQLRKTFTFKEGGFPGVTIFNYEGEASLERIKVN